MGDSVSLKLVNVLWDFLRGKFSSDVKCSLQGLLSDVTTVLPPSASESGDALSNAGTFLVMVPASYLLSLHQILGSPSSPVSFCTLDQVKMVHLVMDAKIHGLVILPTGSGKTLSMFFPVIEEYL